MMRIPVHREASICSCVVQSAVPRIPKKATATHHLSPMCPTGRCQMSHSTHERAKSQRMRVPVSVSPSHAHLTPSVIEQLFCDHYRLHEHSRVGLTQYAAMESVCLIGPNGRSINVRIIGPVRNTNQVELSQGDALKLGIDAPARAPGDLEGTPGILLKGPRTQVALDLGVIRALPHIHMSPNDAHQLELADGDLVDVASESDPQRILFRNVPVLVSGNYRLELHLVSDEGSSAGLAPGDCVRLCKSAAARARSVGRGRKVQRPRG